MVVSYLGFEDAAEKRAENRKFESLATSGTIQEVRKAFDSGRVNCSVEGGERWCTVQEMEYVRLLGPDGRMYRFPPGTTKESAMSYFKKKGVLSPSRPGAEGNTVETAVDSNQMPPEQGEAQEKGPSHTKPPWKSFRPIPGTTMLVNKGGIKSIIWADSNFAIESIKTEDGKLFYKRDAPPFSMYLLHVSWPVLGFLVPWGAIRVITWVLLGFREGSK